MFDPLGLLGDAFLQSLPNHAKLLQAWAELETAKVGRKDRIKAS